MIDKLKQWASDNNLDMYEVARELGVREATIKRWWTGKFKPSRAWAILINEFLTKEGVK